MGEASVLIVENDAELRDRFGEWLESAGYDVTDCPGPMAPDYTCVGSRNQRCPLADAADLVVLDLWLAGDDAMQGASAEELLHFYLWTGRPVVALRHSPDPLPSFEDERLRTHLGIPDRDELLALVGEALKEATTAGS